MQIRDERGRRAQRGDWAPMPDVATHPITRLLIDCPDRPGIVAAVSRFLAGSGANIVDSSQHSTDPEGGSFYMRMEFTLALDGEGDRAAFEARFAQEVAEPFAMTWRMADARRPKRMAILVSRYDH